jgi:hypothetical protein
MNAFFWFVAIVFVSWLFVMFILPLLGKIFLHKLAKNFQQNVDSSQRTQQEPEGTVHIENIPQPHDNKAELGDYVNFEEINDKK